MTSDFTAIDNFCGAGGSTTGLKSAGIRVLHAANHWSRAIESHNTNHPEVDHSCVDLNVAHPGWFPRTTIGWFSIECTTHSPAGGRSRRNPGQIHLWDNQPPDPGVERSRMGAWDVVRFAEYHRNPVIIVENVIEYTAWELFEDWLQVMHKLDYEHQFVCFNSQFAFPEAVPQSRDRLYVVFHQKGNRKPNVDFRPLGICPEHGRVATMQAWKARHAIRRLGKYGKRNQYIYACPHCGVEVSPGTRAARTAIDWSLPMVRIGDRESLGLKPLSQNTLRRIRAGLERFVATPWPDIARRNSTGTDIDSPTATVTTSGRHHSLIVPPFLAAYHGGRHAISCFDEPSPTIATNNQYGVVVPPPFLVHRGYSTDPQYDRTHSIDDPAPTQTTSGKLYIAQPFLSSYYGNGGASPVDRPSPTIRTVQGHALISPETASALVEDCGYRMLKPHEAKLLMGFPVEYVLLGSQKEQFQQAGNAVTPPVAEMLGRAVIESLLAG